jgi:hypothetical protein
MNLIAVAEKKGKHLIGSVLAGFFQRPAKRFTDGWLCIPHKRFANPKRLFRMGTPFVIEFRRSCQREPSFPGVGRGSQLKQFIVNPNVKTTDR